MASAWGGALRIPRTVVPSAPDIITGNPGAAPVLPQQRAGRRDTRPTGSGSRPASAQSEFVAKCEPTSRSLRSPPGQDTAARDGHGPAEFKGTPLSLQAGS